MVAMLVLCRTKTLRPSTSSGQAKLRVNGCDVRANGCDLGVMANVVVSLSHLDLELRVCRHMKLFA